MWVSSIFHKFQCRENRKTRKNTTPTPLSQPQPQLLICFCGGNAVVWNPWKKTAKGMADFGNDEYERMVCVDGAAMKDPITLKPGEEWRGQIQYYLIQSTEPQFSNANQLPVADVAPHSSLQHII